MGIENGEIDPYGGLAYKSYSEIALDITDELSREQIYLDSRKVRMQLERLFAEYVTESQAQYVETADIKAVLDALKQRDIRVGLATADTVRSARNCLQRLGVLENLIMWEQMMVFCAPNRKQICFWNFRKIRAEAAGNCSGWRYI